MSLREAPVGVEDRVVRILPTLVASPARLHADFDEAVPVRIARTVDPSKRSLDRGHSSRNVLTSPVRST